MPPRFFDNPTASVMVVRGGAGHARVSKLTLSPMVTMMMRQMSDGDVPANHVRSQSWPQLQHCPQVAREAVTAADQPRPH